MLCIDLMAYEMPELNEDQQCWLREYLMHWLSIYMNNGMTQAGVTAVLLGEKGRMGGAWGADIMHILKDFLKGILSQNKGVNSDERDTLKGILKGILGLELGTHRHCGHGLPQGYPQ
eukprot:305080-Pelagomonas_calceolata.AAC.3